MSMTHEEKVSQWLRPFSPPGRNTRDFGVEIGAFKTPVPGIRPFYADRFSTYAGERVLADFQCEATELPFHDHSLDYVVISHVLEHMANPVAALWEWTRIVRHGGVLYLVIPDRRYTFDHTRGLTPPEHMLQDFAHGTTYADATHISDYLDQLDWARWNPTATPEQNAVTREELRSAYTAAVAAGQEINIHFHVFEPSNLIELIGLMNRHPQRPGRLELLDTAQRFPRERGDGFLLVLRVHRSLGARCAGALFRWRAHGNAQASLRSSAKFTAHQTPSLPHGP